jgi:hypothetical protein
MRGLLALLVTTGIALTAGVIGYQIGIAEDVAATTGTVVWMGGWGFPGFGFLFFLLFIGFLVFAFGGRRRGWGPGPYGHGPYAGGPGGGWSGDDARRQWIADAHRRLHEEESRGTATTTSAPPIGGPAAG